MNHYEKSWSVYKAHSESYQDDFEYYFNFTKGFRTLETFAGYGRVANFLSGRGIDISINELSPDFKEFFNIPENKLNIGNVLDFHSEKKFERIFAAYNSFCLILNETDVQKLFSVFEQNLAIGGRLSLSYYHPDFWEQAIPYRFEFEGKTVNYTPSFDLGGRQNKKGIWRDQYSINGERLEHLYQVRIYENASDLEQMLTHTKFKLVDEIHNYNCRNILEPGWIEYVLELSA